ncbi:MAG: F0F1 ATP synthase subunit gamma [Clostridiales bacterium]|nr:F0F1 ATP synthase subunit gamma [Clostridiales bacterium]
MANVREIQGRMKSIKDTMKVTNAMYMVSSSKLQKARKDLKNTEPFFFMIQDSLAKILNISPSAGTTFFDERPGRKGDDRRKGYLVITADKGLAGAYNHNVIKMSEESAAMENHNMLFIVGQVGRHYFERKNIPIDINFRYTAQNPTMNRARHISKTLVDLFVNEKLDTEE